MHSSSAAMPAEPVDALGRTEPDARVRGDRTWQRAAVLHQLLLGAAILILTLVVVFWPFPGDVTLFFLGALVIFAATGLTLGLPWHRMPPALLMVIPVVDILAIALIRFAGPTSGVGLLWIFPVSWLAASFGILGLSIGVVLSFAAFVATTVMQPGAASTYSVFLLPLTILAVGSASFVTARRAAAQRGLLDRQAQLLVRALERTRQQELEVTQVLDAVDFGVIRYAPDGSAAVTNEAHARLQRAIGLGAGEDELPVFRSDGVTPLPDDERPLTRAQRGEAFDDELIWFGAPDADRLILSVTARPAIAIDGASDGAVVVSRDVTAEVRALRARDDLVASVSHELRTPLTAILGYLDLAVDDPRVPPSVRANLEVAERNAERLLRIVADILAASSASREGAQLPVRPEAVEVAAVVRATAESFVPRAQERAVEVDVSEVEDVVAHVDPMRLRQVLDNLVANAITYNREGGRVHIASTTDGRSSWIVVRDTGIGMSEKERSGLFQRYFRGAVRAGKAHGTGLGLAISRDIVRAHGGDITVRTVVGEGSTFIVRLPAFARTHLEGE